MTENEAIEVLKTHNNKCSGCDCLCNNLCKPALEMAISALKEIQRYKSVCTPKELKITMPNLTKSIDDLFLNFSASGFTEKFMEFSESTIEEYKQYRAIGTVEECREAQERQRAEKPVKDEYDHKCCPNCGWVVYKDEWGGRYLPHCENCGQAILWESDTQ